MWHTLFILHHNLEARAYAKLFEFEKELREIMFVKGFTFCHSSVLKSNVYSHWSGSAELSQLSSSLVSGRIVVVVG